jgi:hypothetical protein
MIRGVLVTIILTLTAQAIDSETTFENSNFTLSSPLDGTGKSTLHNFNRFRVTDNIHQDNWFVTAIGDIKNTLGHDVLNSVSYKVLSNVRSDTPFSTQTKPYDYYEGQMYAQLYRMYCGYSDDNQRISIGLQKISMGVGRIWNPTDLFNPKNPLALEPDEVYGVLALAYTYTPSPLSQITTVVAQRSDKSYKYAGRVKGYFGFADMAIDVVSANDVAMFGYELEGELLQSGVELRSEGGWFEDKLLDKNFFQGLIGADYAFENSMTLTGEWLHSSKTFENEIALGFPSGAMNNLRLSHDYFGMSLGYELDALLYGALSGIMSAKDSSFYVGPVFRYSLSDDMSAAIGALIYEGSHNSEFGERGQTYYLNFKLTF